MLPFDLKAFLLTLGWWYPKGHAVEWNTRQPWDSHGIWSYAFMGYQFYSTLEKVLERTAFVCGFLFVCMFVCSVLVLDITQVKSIETYFSKCTNFVYISLKKIQN